VLWRNLESRNQQETKEWQKCGQRKQDKEREREMQGSVGLEECQELSRVVENKDSKRTED